MMNDFTDLYPFQQSDCQFLLDISGSSSGARLLANDMGLGKTPTSVTALVEGRVETVLIVCPKPIKETWARQLIDWGFCTRDQICVIENGFDYVKPVKAVIINYELAVAELILKQLLRKRFGAIILDEAKRLKSLGSKRSTLILGGGASSLVSRGYYKWLLDGTIAPNRPIELYPILKTLAPECIKGYTGWEAFGKHFCDGKELDNIPGAFNFKGASNTEELAERMRPFMRRRRISEVYKHLPPVIGHTVYVDCGTFDCDESNTPTGTLRRMVGEAKVPYVAEYLKDWLENHIGEKILVFTYHKTVSDQLRFAFGKNSELIYGDTSEADRKRIVARFQQDKACRVLFAQINVMGEGIDGLQQVCNNILFAELDWSAGGVDQAIGRLRRIGQTKPVNVITLVAEDTLDDSINGTYWSKKRVLDLLLNSHTMKDEDMSLELEVKRLADAAEKIFAHLVGEPVKVENAQKAAELAESEPVKNKGGRPPKAKEEPAKPEAAKTETKAEPAKGNGNGEALTMEVVQDFARQALNAWGGEEPARAKLREVIQGAGVSTLKDAKENHFAGLVAGFKKLIETAGEPAADDLGV